MIGAGPAGLGVGLALQAVPDLRFEILDRGRVGETFRRWPAPLRFLTPSFCVNGYGGIDLNAIHPATSPAYALGTDYPTGFEYARYLESVAAHYRLPVRDGCEVLHVEPDGDAGFVLSTGHGVLRARRVVWAGGEFGEAYDGDVHGAEAGRHVRSAEAWTTRPGAEEEIVVLGGFESGIDVACHHVAAGAHVTVLDPAAPWRARGSDPSEVLAPRTRRRLEEALATERLDLDHGAEALEVVADGDGWTVRTDDGAARSASRPPILATGFGPGLGPVAPLFDAREDGWPLLTDHDESTRTPGLFLAGPAVRHGDLRLCFVFKYRGRFAHVAGEIARRDRRDASGLEAWRTAGMLLDDLSCCGDECAC
ncbi:NAD(P)/FAD-dependent oxidoreductase [Patulibacter sp. S7RM1-6]